jgi:hypothetical protein
VARPEGRRAWYDNSTWLSGSPSGPPLKPLVRLWNFLDLRAKCQMSVRCADSVSSLLGRGKEGSVMGYETWCSLTDDEVAQRDAAEVNLSAALGLPYAGRLDIAAICAKLDERAELVHIATKKGFRRRETASATIASTRIRNFKSWR